jgi:Tol biopolymer transport system component
MDFDPSSGEGGGNVVRLTPNGGSDAWPTWSPDGQRLGFASDRSGNWDIWVINVDGSGLVNLTNSPDDEQYPAWSPDGRQMAFTSGRSGNSDVWLMSVDEGLQGAGSANAVNLTQSPRKDRYAMWSPDGTRIAFNTNRDGNQEIYVMNADGSDPTNVTNAPDSAEGLADWSPNGRRLALYSDRPGNKDIFVVNLGGGDWTNVTNHRTDDEFCTWSP